MNALPQICGAGIFSSQQSNIKRFHGTIRTPVREVERYELELYCDEGGFMQLNGREYPMRRGTLLVARPGDQRCSTLPFRCHFVRLWQVEPELERLLVEVAGITLTDHPEPFETAFENIRSWFLSDDPFNRLAAVGELFSLLRMIRRQRLFSSSEAGEGEDVLTQAQRYIERHYHEELSVEQIARACHVSVSYLHRLFAERLEQTPHAALLRQRITAAKTMLMNEACPIAEIAWRCGFNSPCYFSDCFRKSVGMSPREFREQMAYQL